MNMQCISTFVSLISNFQIIYKKITLALESAFDNTVLTLLKLSLRTATRATGGKFGSSKSNQLTDLTIP